MSELMNIFDNSKYCTIFDYNDLLTVDFHDTMEGVRTYLETEKGEAAVFKLKRMKVKTKTVLRHQEIREVVR